MWRINFRAIPEKTSNAHPPLNHPRHAPQPLDLDRRSAWRGHRVWRGVRAAGDNAMPLPLDPTMTTEEMHASLRTRMHRREWWARAVQNENAAIAELENELRARAQRKLAAYPPGERP